MTTPPVFDNKQLSLRKGTSGKVNESISLVMGGLAT